MTICARLKQLRIAQGWSKRFVAAQLNIHPSTYAIYERRASAISFSRFIQLVLLFQTTADELLALAPQPPQKTDTGEVKPP